VPNFVPTSKPNGLLELVMESDASSHGVATYRNSLVKSSKTYKCRVSVVVLTLNQ
jgi:hypothetical protein